jgi:hypothetical protein
MKENSYSLPFLPVGNRDSSVGIATNYRLDAPGSVPGSSRFYFSVLHVVQTGSGAHLASYIVNTEGFFFGVKAAEA